MPASIRMLAAVGFSLALSACGKPAAPAGPSPEAKAALAALPAPYNTGDVVHGKALFAQCRSCHTLVKDGADMTGPNLHGIFGRHTGSRPGFNYSPAMRGENFTWDAGHLDTWLTNPRAFLPGTKMTFLGLPDQKDRIDVIAYLKTEGGDAPQ